MEHHPCAWRMSRRCARLSLSALLLPLLSQQQHHFVQGLEVGFSITAEQQEASQTATGSSSTSGSRLDPYQRAILFHSAACKNFYRQEGAYDDGNTVVWEDLHPEPDRGANVTISTDIVYCPQQALVYVDNVKVRLERAKIGCRFSCSPCWQQQMSILKLCYNHREHHSSFLDSRTSKGQCA